MNKLAPSRPHPHADEGDDDDGEGDQDLVEPPAGPSALRAVGLENTLQA